MIACCLKPTPKSYRVVHSIWEVTKHLLKNWIYSELDSSEETRRSKCTASGTHGIVYNILLQVIWFRAGPNVQRLRSSRCFAFYLSSRIRPPSSSPWAFVNAFLFPFPPPFFPPLSLRRLLSRESPLRMCLIQIQHARVKRHRQYISVQVPPYFFLIFSPFSMFHFQMQVPFTLAVSRLPSSPWT